MVEETDGWTQPIALTQIVPMCTIVTTTWMLGVATTMLVSSPVSAQRRSATNDTTSRDSLLARDSVSSRGLRWQLAPLLDGARSVVVPAMPHKPVRTSVWQREPDVAQAPVEFYIRIIVPDTTRLAPMPVIRPTHRP